MAFTDCPECGLEISDRAPACPRCGYPMKQKPVVRYVSGVTGLDAAKSIVGRVLLGGAVFLSGALGENPPAILCSLIIFGSTIPVWLKARRFERRRSSGEVESVESPADQHLIEAEARKRHQAAELDQASQRVEDLQERLEFLERLVAKRQQALD
jgi:hypothetical protein